MDTMGDTTDASSYTTVGVGGMDTESIVVIEVARPLGAYIYIKLFVVFVTIIAAAYASCPMQRLLNEFKRWTNRRDIQSVRATKCVIASNRCIANAQFFCMDWLITFRFVLTLLVGYRVATNTNDYSEADDEAVNVGTVAPLTFLFSLFMTLIFHFRDVGALSMLIGKLAGTWTYAYAAHAILPGTSGQLAWCLIIPIGIPLIHLILSTRWATPIHVANAMWFMCVSLTIVFTCVELHYFGNERASTIVSSHIQPISIPLAAALVVTIFLIQVAIFALISRYIRTHFLYDLVLEMNDAPDDEEAPKSDVNFRLDSSDKEEEEAAATEAELAKATGINVQ